MNELVLRLLPDNQEPQELVLQQHQLSSSILDMANATSSYVFNDYKYRAQIVNCNEVINNLVFLLNGKEIGITYSPDTGMITYQDYSFGQRIFLECYGFVQITLIFNDAQGNRQVRDTEYIHVLVRKGRQNDSVRRMTEYVYAQNADLLNGNRTLPKDVSGLKESARKTIESHILLLKQISVTYEENYRYFKMNSRFITTPKEHVDHFEKLQYVSRNTLQYIAQHPEELQQVHHSSGIRIRNFRYQPNKTLVTDNEKSYDIYENRVVLGFLLFLVHEIERIQAELSEIIGRVPQKIAETEEYVTSSYFIYEKTVEVIKILLEDVRDLHRRFTSLYYMYAEALPIKPENISIIPRFTPLFKAVPQYHQIYDCAVAWFSKGVFTIREEQFMLSFIKISTLYEVYVLTKLVNYFKSSGYTLTAAEKIPYPSPGRYFENTYCNNRFIFKNDSGQVTVYYQPVIYSTNHKDISGIGLYRNTSISFPKAHDGSSYRGRHYTPDFLIKYEYFGVSTERYIIADAKFSRLQTVKDREFAELAYKYLFSISPISPEGHVVGMCIFNGISESESQRDCLTNIYDFELATPITPRADIVTLTENEEDNISLHDALLRNSVGIYVTETVQKPAPLPVPHSTDAPTPQATVVAPSRLETPIAHTNALESSVRPSAALNDASPSSTVNKRDGSFGIAISPRRKDAAKDAAKKKSKVAVVIDEIQLSELNLDKDIEARLIAAGYTTIQDLVPNKKRNDLLSISILNRKIRREIEAKLKQRRILLR
jgi:hypothetical protein